MVDAVVYGLAGAGLFVGGMVTGLYWPAIKQVFKRG